MVHIVCYNAKAITLRLSSSNTAAVVLLWSGTLRQNSSRTSLSSRIIFRTSSWALCDGLQGARRRQAQGGSHVGLQAGEMVFLRFLEVADAGHILPAVHNHAMIVIIMVMIMVVVIMMVVMVMMTMMIVMVL